MLPLSPPTDSLYKFISLFGLAILILASYKSGKTFEALSANRVAMEGIKKDIRVEMAGHYIQADSGSVEVATATTAIRQLPDDADAVLKEVAALPLSLKAKMVFDGEVKKLKAERNSLDIRITEYIVTLMAGIMLVVTGFMLWYKRDQLFKDRLLKAELERKTVKHTEEFIGKKMPVM
jgi:hypothetical protein